MSPPHDPGPPPPTRLTTAEVCALARISRASLWRRVADGRLPAPIDHARQALFCSAAVERALSLHAAPEPSALERAIAEKIARRRLRHEAG